MEYAPSETFEPDSWLEVGTSLTQFGQFVSSEH